MPVYEYQCTSCSERIQRLENVGADSSGNRCPSCKNGTIKKVFSTFGTGGSADCAPPSKSKFR